MSSSARTGNRLPLLAIVGRPNVGKSTLFNRLAGRRKAIVSDRPGLTRDRNFERAEWRGREFMVVDTGGYEPEALDELRSAIREQTTLAIEEADAIILLVDVRDGLMAGDREIMDLLRRTDKPLFVAVNKCDKTREHQEAMAFWEIGAQALHAISALKGHGVGDLMDAVLDRLAPPAAEPEEEEGERPPRIAIVGRWNVGKSTLVNAILGEKRVIVGPTPGITRDAIDSRVVVNGKPYVIVDTAGIRRRGKIERGAEKLSVLRSVISMEQADAAVLLIDASEGLTIQDAHVAGQALEAGCATILAVNKWDLVKKDNSTAGAWAKALRAELGFLSYAPIVFISALVGQRVQRIFQLVDRILVEHRKRIETAEFNRWLAKTTASHTPPVKQGKTLRIKYGTQTGVAPPTFALFVNDPSAMHFSYQRYLINQLRETYGFEGTPIRLRLRKKS